MLTKTKSRIEMAGFLLALSVGLYFAKSFGFAILFWAGVGILYIIIGVMIGAAIFAKFEHDEGDVAYAIFGSVLWPITLAGIVLWFFLKHQVN